MSDPFVLERFLQAQKGSYPAAVAELRAGLKRSHWIWYVFPQLGGLGSSTMARHYAITGLAEAAAYLDHPVLGVRLIEAVSILLGHEQYSAEQMLGSLDALKLRSCLTLFANVPGADPIFVRAIDRFFAGNADPLTLRILVG